MDIVDVITEVTGLSYQVSESITVVILIGLIYLLARVTLWLVRTLFSVQAYNSKQDTKQLDLQEQLVTMAARSNEENTKLREAYQKNLLVIEEHTEVLRGIRDVLINFNSDMGVLNSNVTDLKKVSEIRLQDIHSSLIKTSETTVVVVDSDDTVVAEFTATPENGKLVIRFNSVL